MKTKQTYLEPEAIVLVVQSEAIICASASGTFSLSDYDEEDA